MAKSSNSIAAVKSEDDWQTESDLRTVLECEKIEKDPKRMAKVRALAKSKPKQRKPCGQLWTKLATNFTKATSPPGAFWQHAKQAG